VSGRRVVAVGGGHGLAVTVRACRAWAEELTVVVSVADDGGSSGRLRRAVPGLPAVGDLRRCITSLADPRHAALARALEQRPTVDELAGHPPGNLLLAALVEECGGLEAAAGALAAALGVTATVVPATAEPVDLVGVVGRGTEIVGQVAVESAGGIGDVRLEPQDPAISKAASAALAALGPDDLVVLGPGSFLGSVVAALAAPRLGAAIGASAARRVLVHNLFSPSGLADRLALLGAHGVPVDAVVVQDGQSGLGDLEGASALDGVQVVRADVARGNGLAHDVDRLSAVLRGL
jgi:uncharacterized cofD-like protein